MKSIGARTCHASPAALALVAGVGLTITSAAIVAGCSQGIGDESSGIDRGGSDPDVRTSKLSSACKVDPRHRPPQLGPRTRLYVPQGSPAAQAADRYREAGLEEEAVLMEAMAAQPQVVYLVGGSPEEIREYVRETMRKARRQRQLPVFAAYNVPGRDCSQYSGGGANTEEEYQAWIDAIAGAIGHERAVVLVEPDGVALLPSEPWCAEGGGGSSGEPEDVERVAERFRELRYAVERLEALPRVDVYLDAGHSSWHPLSDYDAYYGEPQLQFGIVNRLMLAGVAGSRGFFINPSNHRRTEDLLVYGERLAKCLALVQADPGYSVPDVYEPNVVYDADGRFSSPCPSDEELDAMPLTRDLLLRMPHFVLDTSRNGQGPWNLGDPETGNDDAAAFEVTYGYATTDPEIWCNAPGRGLGLRPSTRTGHPLADAFLWIKVPGESDGQCGRNLTAPDPTWPSQYDVAWGQVDPLAGQWFEAQALELARLADPPLLP